MSSILTSSIPFFFFFFLSMRNVNFVRSQSFIELGILYSCLRFILNFPKSFNNLLIVVESLYYKMNVTFHNFE